MAAEPIKDRHIRRQIIIGTAANSIAKFVALGTWFFLTPFILRELGVAQYSLWVLVGSVVAYGSLLDFGIGGAVVKYIAEHRSRNDLGAAQSLIATALWLYCGLGLLAVLASLVLAPLFPALIHLPPEEEATARWLIIVMGINVGVALPSAVPLSVLRGLQRYEITNALSTIALLISAGATAVILWLGGGVVAMAAVNIPIALATQIPGIIAIARIAPELRFGWRGARRDLAWEVLTFSSSIFLNDVAGYLQTKTDELVIAASMAIGAVAPYSIARKLSEAALLFTDQFLKVLLPIASSLHAENDRRRLQALYLNATRLACAIYLAFGLILVMLAGPLLTLWVGAEYAAYAPLVTILTVAGLISISQWSGAAILQGMARHRILGFTALGSGIANLLLSLTLIGPLGLVGVALGTLIPTAIECIFIIQPYALRTIGVRWGDILRQAYGPALLPALPAVAVLATLQQMVAINSFWMLALVAGAGLAVYLTGYFTLGAGSVERNLIRDAVQRVSGMVQTYRAGP